MSRKIGAGNIVVYKSTKDYFLYRVADVKGNIVTLEPIKNGVACNTVIRAIRCADSTEIETGFRVPNPSNYTANDKMYFNGGYR